MQSWLTCSVRSLKSSVKTCENFSCDIYVISTVFAAEMLFLQEKPLKAAANCCTDECSAAASKPTVRSLQLFSES